MESIQEVKHIYALTEEQAKTLKGLMRLRSGKGGSSPDRRWRR